MVSGAVQIAMRLAREPLLRKLDRIANLVQNAPDDLVRLRLTFATIQDILEE